MSSNVRSIDVSIDIEASREQVWDALTNPVEIESGQSAGGVVLQRD